jgi:hypothetical protein
MWRIKTFIKKETDGRAALVDSLGEFKTVIVDTNNETLISKEEKSTIQILDISIHVYSI